MPDKIILQAVLFVCLLAGAVWQDLQKREIPPFIWSLIACISFLDFRPSHLMGILAAVPLLVIATWIAPNRLGGGDIKLVAATGLVLGLQATNFAVIVGLSLQILVFAVFSFIHKIKKQERKELSMPLAPCLSLGFISIYILKLGGFIHEFI
ncbi:MAG TPA: A24 family peptidase [Lachnospiraceae bacterium]|nr:A24 family peptidase [Lachnospiraceae bacterium]